MQFLTTQIFPASCYVLSLK